jgi:hypothetical protein
MAYNAHGAMKFGKQGSSNGVRFLTATSLSQGGNVVYVYGKISHGNECLWKRAAK